MQNKDEESLLSRWKNRSVEKRHGIEPRRDTEVIMPLSTGQQRLYFLQSLYPGNPFYNYADIYHFAGSVDVNTLIKALEVVFQRHKILHTVFAIRDGKVVQEVRPSTFNILDQDLTSFSMSDVEDEIANRLRSHANEFFDLEKGPLSRVVFLRTSSGCSVLLNMHHIVMDKWSMRILRNEWADSYRALIGNKTMLTPQKSIDYLDYAAWEQQQTADQKHLAYWKTKLSGEIPKLDLPHDYLRPVDPSFAGSFSRYELEEELSGSLQQTAAELNCTLFVLILAAFKLVMSRYGGQDDVLVGTPVTNRDYPELEPLVGFFNDTVVLRSRVVSTTTFRHFVQEVRQTVLEAFSHKQVSFGEVINALGLPRDDGKNPLFQVMFLYHNVPPMADFGDEIEVHHEPFDLGVAKFDLTLYVENRGGKLSLIHEYSTELFEADTIRQFEASLVHVLEQVAGHQSRELGQFSLLTEVQTKMIVNTWNDTVISLEDQPGILSRIRQHTLATPNAISIYADGETLTFAQLEQQSDNIAALLQGYVESNQKIGLCLPPSTMTVLGIVSILKAGCAYVPLDPSYPEERLRFMANDSQMTMLLTSSKVDFAWSDLKILFIEDMAHDESGDFQRLEENPLDLAYLIYTSGSSGQPKGVMVNHENLKYSTLARTMVYEDVPRTFLLMSSFSFDSSVAGIFWTLISGGKLVLAPRHLEQDIQALQKVIEEQQVTHTLMLPSLFQILLEFGDAKQLSSLQCTIVAGEACRPGLVHLHHALLPAARLYNEYGPTEATVWCTVQELSQGLEARKVAIGKPIPNAKAYIVSEDLRPTPPGIAGELLIGGKGLTSGYFRREELTRLRYIRNPFVPSEKLYRTGDRARFRSDGVIDFLGRIDDQVKIRGYRIEPGEIAETVERFQDVQQAVVLTPLDAHGNASLVAYVVGSNALNTNELRGLLQESLPSYMVPDQLHRVDSLPLLPNGKIDTLTLKSMVLEQESAQQEQAQVGTTIQLKLVEIWTEVLGKGEVGINDNFFSIGGDSIKSIQIIAKARAQGLKIAPDMIFRKQTIAELAEVVEELSDLSIDQGQSRGQLPWSPIQHWFFQEHEAAPQHWNQAYHIVLRNAMPKARISSAVKRLVEYHDSLRLGFLEDGSAQYIAEDTLRVRSAVAQSLSEVLQSTQKSFRLDSGNLFQLVTVEDDLGLVSEIVMVAHHLVVDAISWEILLDDLHTILDASPLVLKVPLPQKTHSYQDWTIALVAKADKLNGDLSWWKQQVQQNATLPTKKMVQMPIREEDIRLSHLIIDHELTARLTGRTIQSHRIAVEDILLLAFYRAWRSWSGSNTLNLLLERHGRDVEPDLELSRSVGWFTSFFPFKLEQGDFDSTMAELRALKEQRLEVPNKGRDFGILKYVLNESLEYHWTQVVFNFLGESNSRKRPLFKKIEFLPDQVRDPQSERSYLLEINMAIRDGQLETHLSYPKTYLDQYEMEKLLGAFDGELEQIIDHCENAEEPSLDVSDFPDAGLSQEGLDHLLSELN